MKTLSGNYRTQLTALSEAANALQVCHNELAQLVMVGVEAGDIVGFRRAKQKLDAAYGRFDGVMGQIDDLIASAKAFAPPPASAE